MTDMNYDAVKNISVLVVDDEADIREILSRTIESEGILCYTAPSAEKAMKLLSQYSFDVVITDIVMPGASGIELLDSVKSKYHADVIVMTGFSQGMRYEEIIEKGACDFIQKPLSPREVIIRLKRVLRERSILAERDRSEENLKQSYLKLKRILDETVNALGAALEMRDPYTAGHQKRVALLANAIAEKMSLPQTDIEGIHFAALLHDIGKISVPAEILNKPSELSVNEMNIIKEHPGFGYEILKEIEFEHPVADIVIQHHERINGTGYPAGISGDAISRDARILVACDVVEAIASHRPYRQGLGIDVALDELETNRGILYDADVVDICMLLFKEEKYELHE